MAFWKQLNCEGLDRGSGMEFGVVDRYMYMYGSDVILVMAKGFEVSCVDVSGARVDSRLFQAANSYVCVGNSSHTSVACTTMSACTFTLSARHAGVLLLSCRNSSSVSNMGATGETLCGDSLSIDLL